MPLEPTLADILGDHRDAMLSELHVAMPGRVQKYDASKQVADVIPCVKGTIPDSDGNTLIEDRPVIPNVPVAWYRGGGFSMTFPLAPGDHVWLVFNSDAIAQWRNTGEISEPGDLRRSSLSYPFAIPAAAPDTKPITDPGSSSEAVISVPGGATMRVGGGGAGFVALASKVETELSKIATAFSTFIPGSGGASFPQPYTTPSSGVVAATKFKAE